MLDTPHWVVEGLLLIEEIGYIDNSLSTAPGLAGPRDFLLLSMYSNYEG